MNFASILRRKQTDAELKLWYFLRDRRFDGWKFRRQHPIGSYVVDFCCVEKMLVIGLDGGQHLEQKSQDEQREKDLNSKGYQILRFWDHEILKEADSILERIKESMGNPHPNLLPEREKGIEIEKNNV